MNLQTSFAMNTISPSDRLILALDVPTKGQALELVVQVGDHVSFFKVGLELLSSGTGIDLIEQLTSRGCSVFADFKLYDIPQTVHRAVRNLNGLGIRFLTVHGDPAVMQAAVDAAEDMQILAVTVLTSLDDQALKTMGFATSSKELVRARALSAHQSGCAGVIASGQEVQTIRSELGENFLIVTPGIRNRGDAPGDQKRTVNVAEAIQAGADYLVVGRPIRDADQPSQAAKNFQSEIRSTLAAQ